MAIYHFSAKPIGRATGRSATGAAAYRAGVSITDRRTGEIHDYTRKGGVLHAEIVLPGGATANRSEFWNGIELHHKRGDAVLVREVEISLPSELIPEQRKALAVGYARELADRYGVAADVALHAPRTVTDRDLENTPDQYHETDPKTGRRHNGNWHAHIMLSACHVQPDGTLGKKAVELDPIHCQRAKIENMADRERARWGELANAALERQGHEARIDHRSHAERGIQAEPSRHLGPAASGYERRTGKRSRRGQDHDQAATERLRKAQEAGQLARQAQAVDSWIIDVSGDLQAALRERDQAQAAAQQASDAERLAAFEAQTTANMAALKAQHAAQSAAGGIDPRSHYHPDKVAAREAAARAAEKEAAQQEQQRRDAMAKKAAAAARQQSERPVPVPRPTPAAVRAPQARPDPEEAERQRLARMTSAELAEEIRRRQLPDVDSLVERDQAVRASAARLRELRKQEENGKAFMAKAERAIQDWREQHPVKAKMHDAGVFRNAELEQLGHRAEQGGQALQALQAQAGMVAAKTNELRRDARYLVIANQASDRAELKDLEQLRQDKASQEQEQQRREKAEKSIQRDLQAVPKDFRAMAAGREVKAYGWSDTGDKWKAAPAQLKQLIDGYNAVPRGEARAAFLDRLTSGRGSSQQLRELLDTQKANERQNDREHGR